MKFRKKPVVIDAYQWFKDGDHPRVSAGYMKLDTGAVFGVSSVPPEYNIFGHIPVFCIKTLEGWHQVRKGDWIIRGVKDEYYPCAPDIFELTYEPAE